MAGGEAGNAAVIPETNGRQVTAGNAGSGRQAAENEITQAGRQAVTARPRMREYRNSICIVHPGRPTLQRTQAGRQNDPGRQACQRQTQVCRQCRRWR